MPTAAYRVTRARRVFVNAPQVKRVLAAELDDNVKPHFVQAFEAVVANWKHKPAFKARKFITADALAVNVYPDGPNKQIYEYVTLGTKEHDIPKTPKTGNDFLIFMWGGPGSYKAKTGAGGKWGGPGTVSGGTLHRRHQVHHPGTEPRDFEGFIRKREKHWFSRTMENAWRRALKAMQQGG
jgi:hypothetical protein